MSPALVNVLGYTASFIILVSLTMKSIVKLRIINAAGSLLFVLFAVLTLSWPTVVMNVGIICIDLWYVLSVSHTRAEYRLVRAERGSAWLEFFYETHEDEISRIFGSSAFSDAKGFSYFVCNNEIAGLFAWKDAEGGDCRILIDYVTPRYRDTRIGRYFFQQQLPHFREQGFRRFVYRDVGPEHWAYLRRIGFTETDEGGCFAKEI
jgi:GNAT superfamily N-acetyltransferase